MDIEQLQTENEKLKTEMANLSAKLQGTTQVANELFTVYVQLKGHIASLETNLQKAQQEAIKKESKEEI